MKPPAHFLTGGEAIVCHSSLSKVRPHCESPFGEPSPVFGRLGSLLTRANQTLRALTTYNRIFEDVYGIKIFLRPVMMHGW